MKRGEEKQTFLAAAWTNLLHNTDYININININEHYILPNFKNLCQKNFKKMCLGRFYFSFSSTERFWVFFHGFFKQTIHKVVIQILENINSENHSVVKLQSAVTVEFL